MNDHLKVPTTPKCSHGIYLTVYCYDCALDKPPITKQDLENAVQEDIPESPPAYSFFPDAKVNKAIGVLMTCSHSALNVQFKQTYLLDISWTLVPWYARLLGLLRLPYDITKFIITGRFTFIPWPWRW